MNTASLDSRGRLVKFNDMTINEAVDYYTGKGMQSKYHNLFLNTILECLKNGAYGKFSNSEIDILMMAIKEGYDFRWLIGDFNTEEMLKILNVLRKDTIAKCVFNYYTPDRLSMIQNAVLTDKNIRPFARECFDNTCNGCTLITQSLYKRGYNLINDEFNPRENTFIADVVDPSQDNKFICRINLMVDIDTIVSSYLEVHGIK